MAKYPWENRNLRWLKAKLGFASRKFAHCQFTAHSAIVPYMGQPSKFCINRDGRYFSVCVVIVDKAAPLGKRFTIKYKNVRFQTLDRAKTFCNRAYQLQHKNAAFDDVSMM